MSNCEDERQEGKGNGSAPGNNQSWWTTPRAVNSQQAANHVPLARSHLVLSRFTIQHKRRSGSRPCVGYLNDKPDAQ
jgi:hypothetical protein